MAQDVPPPGLVAGKYRLTQLIGRGGMGSVWEGTHTTLGTHVAVKFIESEYAESPEARNRFENEARAAAKLRSKHVVEVYDHGLTEDGRPYIVMEYLRGEPLDKRLERAGRLPARDTARVLLQVCRALSKAHSIGIVHRDLKPENVFLVWDEEDGADVAKVVDFGIAKFADNQLGNSSATRTGSVLGTPYYMSPEQARGLRTVDHRSDLWSVGVIAYRCMVGALPFEGEAVGDLLVKLCTAPLPVPSQMAGDLPPGFDAWFNKALCREPEGRFSTAAELAESLAAVCGVPVRGSYATADIPIPSYAGGPNASSSPAITPAPNFMATPSPHGMTPQGGVMPVTPYPVADRTGPNPAFGSSASTMQMAATGAPTTQTPAPTGGRSKGAIVAAAAAAVVMLGIGVGVLLKVLGGSDTAAAAPPPVETVSPAPPPAPAPVAPAPEQTAQLAVEPAAPTPSVAPAAAPAPAPAKPARPQPARPQPAKPGKDKPAAAPAPGADVGF